MNPRSDYAVYTMDADAPVRWEDIEQVLIAVPQSCPICLQPPVAARITKCGHVYCFSCVLRYLSLNESNKAWRKCPICWDAIYEKDLKSVRSALEDQHIYDQGEKEIAKQIASKQDVQLEMRLIQRTLVRILQFLTHKPVSPCFAILLSSRTILTSCVHWTNHDVRTLQSLYHGHIRSRWQRTCYQRIFKASHHWTLSPTRSSSVG